MYGGGRRPNEKSMIIGWFMGGPQNDTRGVLATVTSMRNVALCLLIVMKSFSGRGMEVPLVAFSALMIPSNLIFTLVSLVYRRKQSKVSSTSNDEEQQAANHKKRNKYYSKKLNYHED